ncbi:hypothetical protein BD408DRAFT_460274 [Parasitella parasitica]|nr:hypothetical protein BD408DRAFT_460274 [Parasitella parasitica]
MGTRPHYDWSPSDSLTELLHLDAPLHTSNLLADSERKAFIESYPPIAHLDYKAPATIPQAERLMNKGQRLEDSSLKHIQYLLSAIFRPLDILSHEMVSSESDNPNLERYCTMLQDVRRLLLHACSSITQSRNNIALRAVNPAFSMKTEPETNYTLPLDESQQTLIQQTAARKATREATASKRQRRTFSSGTSGPLNSFSNDPNPQFFRSGPPSQQGGYNSNSNNNSNFTSNNNISNFRQNNNNTSNFRQHNSNNSNNSNKKKPTNPFRQ